MRMRLHIAFNAYCRSVVENGVVTSLARCLEQPDADKIFELISTEPVYDECFEALKAIWQLHTLAFAFEVPVEIIRCPPGESVDRLDASSFPYCRAHPRVSSTGSQHSRAVPIKHRL